jgi:hypothetical protein
MQADVRQKYNEIFREHFGQARVLTATTCITAPMLWKPDGIVLVILDSWAQQSSKVSCYDLGRWVSATLTGSDGDVTIYSFYNVVDVKLQNTGPSTVFSQQYRLLRLAAVMLPNPRQQCVEDLQRAGTKSVANKEAIVIIGDYNKVLGKNAGLMASVCSANELFDVHALFHGENNNIPTYTRGTKRLYYCVASTILEDFVASCGYNLFNENIHSDYQAQFVDFKLKSFFGHGAPPLARPGLRSISSSSTKVTKFVRKMHTHLTEHQAFHMYQSFRIDADVLDEPWKMANKLDRLIGQAFKTAEKTCVKPPKPHGLLNSTTPASKYATGQPLLLKEGRRYYKQRSSITWLQKSGRPTPRRSPGIPTKHQYTQEYRNNGQTGLATDTQERGGRKRRLPTRTEGQTGASHVHQRRRRYLRN